MPRPDRISGKGHVMANDPQKAKEKRSPPLQRRNAQGDHGGSAHRPEEFDNVNPQKQGADAKKNPAAKGE
jgi:hypothetical protein